MFTGRRYDPEAGLYYYRARYYAHDIGRFLQTDPIGYAAGLNLYTYVRNNPVNWIDPYGLIDWGGLLSGIVHFAGGGAIALFGAGIVGGSGGVGIILGGGALMAYGSYNLGYGTTEILMALNDVKAHVTPILNTTSGIIDIGVGIGTGNTAGVTLGVLEILDVVIDYTQGKAEIIEHRAAGKPTIIDIFPLENTGKGCGPSGGSGAGDIEDFPPLPASYQPFELPFFMYEVPYYLPF